MEDLLIKNYRYRFTLIGNGNSRQFSAKFDKISSPCKTLFVTEYSDKNGDYDGIRTLPFSWVTKVELLEDTSEVETVLLDTIPDTRKRNKPRPTKMTNNFMT
jgi:hypothetical protein